MSAAQGTSTDEVSARMATLGKMAAALTHELNNPAAAGQRAASELAEFVDRLHVRGLELGGAVSATERSRLIEMVKDLTEPAESSDSVANSPADPLARADLEDGITTWLEQRGVSESWKLAPDLADAGLDTERLNVLARDLPADHVGDAVAWLAEALRTRKLVEQVLQSSKRISELVAAVKSYSSVDRAPIQEFDIHDGLESTLVIMGHRLKGVNVVRRYDRSLPKIHANSGELNQVWTNLIDNAVDAMQCKGTLEIETYGDGDSLVVAITDSGSGIPAEVLPHIFEPFFTTKTLDTGMGLGLDICRQIVVARQHGEIFVQSEPGRTTFTVSLPVNALSGPDRSDMSETSDLSG